MRDVRANAELEAFHAGGEGLVFNHFASGPAGARDNVLHTAGCPQVGKMLIRARPESRPVRKVLFATAEEARSWLTASLDPEGHGWRSCTRCQPGGAAERTPPPARPQAVPGMAGAAVPVMRGSDGRARFLVGGRGLRDARQPAAAAAGPAKARELEPGRRPGPGPAGRVP
jgi:hypothetical protein